MGEWLVSRADDPAGTQAPHLPVATPRNPSISQGWPDLQLSHLPPGAEHEAATGTVGPRLGLGVRQKDGQSPGREVGGRPEPGAHLGHVPGNAPQRAPSHHPVGSLHPTVPFCLLSTHNLQLQVYHRCLLNENRTGIPIRGPLSIHSVGDAWDSAVSAQEGPPGCPGRRAPGPAALPMGMWCRLMAAGGEGPAVEPARRSLPGTLSRPQLCGARPRAAPDVSTAVPRWPSTQDQHPEGLPPGPLTVLTQRPLCIAEVRLWVTFLGFCGIKRWISPPRNTLPSHLIPGFSGNPPRLPKLLPSLFC